MSGSEYFDVWHQLIEIKNLLIAVLVVTFFMFVAFAAMFYSFVKANRMLHVNIESRAFQAEAATLLDQGSYVKLKELASGREISSPGDPLAHYYLGIAHFRSNEYVESKKCFTRLIQLDPRYKKVAETYLAQIDEALRQVKPKLV